MTAKTHKQRTDLEILMEFIKTNTPKLGEKMGIPSMVSSGRVKMPVVKTPSVGKHREFHAGMPRGPGYQVHFSNFQCQHAIRVSEGNIRQAAKLLAVSAPSIDYRIKRDPEVWPVEVERRRCGRPEKVSSVAVTRAIRLAGGSMGKACQALGLSHSAGSKRVGRHPELWPKGVKRLVGGRPKKK